MTILVSYTQSSSFINSVVINTETTENILHATAEEEEKTPEREKKRVVCEQDWLIIFQDIERMDIQNRRRTDFPSLRYSLDSS